MDAITRAVQGQKVRKRMKEVELVIKTPEKIYESVMDGTYCGTLYQELKNGTPLPKGHGRLIDADYKVSSDGRTIDAVCGYMAPTIIEADKAESEG